MAAMPPKVKLEDIIKLIGTNSVGVPYIRPLDREDIDEPRSLKCIVVAAALAQFG